MNFSGPVHAIKSKRYKERVARAPLDRYIQPFPRLDVLNFKYICFYSTFDAAGNLMVYLQSYIRYIEIATPRSR